MPSSAAHPGSTGRGTRCFVSHSTGRTTPIVASLPPVLAAWADTLEPSSGPRAGGTRIVIEGDYLGGGTDYRCRIAGGEDVAGVEVENEFGSRYSDFTASPHIECVTPPRDGAASDVEAAGLSISLNSADWTDTSLDFEYYPPLVATAITPGCVPAGVELDGLTLEVPAAAFFSEWAPPQLLCRVGAVTLGASFSVDATTGKKLVTCGSITIASAGAQALGVSANGVTFDEAALLSVHAKPTVTSASIGVGGNVVTGDVTGIEFDDVFTEAASKTDAAVLPLRRRRRCQPGDAAVPGAFSCAASNGPGRRPRRSSCRSTACTSSTRGSPSASSRSSRSSCRLGRLTATRSSRSAAPP